jgi:hypothetical protein
MSATDTFETNLLSLLFKNVTLANVGDSTGIAGSSTAGSFYISLHTATPDETGNQSTNEATYTGVNRPAVARSTAGWTVVAGVADNIAAIAFATCTGGSSTVTHFGVGSAASTAGNLFLYGTLTASRAVSTGIAPEFAIGALDVSLT